MSARLRTAVVALSAALLAPVNPAGAAPSGAADPPAPTPAGSPARTDQVTLLTGDVVTLRTYPDGRQAAEVDPVDPGTGFRTVESKGHLSVVPADALPYLSGGQLDPRLFDVTQLVADGLSDPRSATLPLIVRYPTRRAAQSADLPGKTRDLPSIGALAAAPPKRELAGVWQDWVDVAAAGGRVWLDAPVRAVLDQSVPMIGAPEAWQAGLSGSGVPVAVLDTGYDPNHPDLAGAVSESANFTTTSPDTVDRNGHGTHVASTIAGTGAASGGKYRGVAQDADLLVGKILDDSGRGATSWAIAGMEWAASRGARVVNMSIGSDPSNGTDPMSLALNRLTASSGTLFVVAAGNGGPVAQSVSSPGTADAALTVGNVTKTGELNSGSGRGPRFGDLAVKPDVTAPGTEIVAARAANTFRGRPLDDNYAALTGTSMATPHVTGAAALLAQQHPDWRAGELKAALTTTATPHPNLTVYEQGAGLIDVGRAAAARLTASVGTLSFGRFDFPHDGDEPVARTVTYRNGATSDATLDLSVDVTSDRGEPATGAVTLSEPSLTVPAGGEHTVTLSVDVDGAPGVGLFGGHLSAAVRGSGTTLTTSLGFAKDEPTFDVTVEGIARDGRPAHDPSGVDLFRLETGEFFDKQLPADGIARFRLPAGTYAVAGFMFTMDEPGKEEIEKALVIKPEVRITADTTIRLDAREAVPVTLDVGRDTDPLLQTLTWHRTNGRDSLTVSFKTPTTVRRLYATPTAPVATGEFETYGKWELVAPRARMRLGAARLDPYLLFGSAPVHGTFTLDIVDAGTGTPDELAAAGAAGRTVLLRPSPTFRPFEQVAAAQAAGAVTMLLANDVPGVLDPGTGSNVRIPVIGLSKADGDAIRARKPGTAVVLSGADVRRTPFLYDLVVPWPDRIPQSLHTRIRGRDVATLITDYTSGKDGQIGRELRHHWRPYSLASTAFGRDIVLPQRRTDYVSAHDSVWQQTVRLVTPSSAELVEATRAYPPGTVEARSWFRGPIAPGPQHRAIVRLDRGVPVNRWDNTLFVGMSPFRDADPTHVGDLQGFLGDTSTARIWRGDTLIFQGTGLTGSYVVPAEPATYRLALDVTRTGEFWPTSTATSTEWTLRSGHPATLDPTVLPLVDVRAEVLSLDLRNTSAPLPLIPVVVTAGRQDGAPEPAMKDVRLAVSYDDGARWRSVRLLPLGSGRYAALVPNPRTGGFASLRMSATDVQGNAMTQTVTRAYALPG